MQIVEYPALAPGQCFLTQTSIGPFLDTGLDIDDIFPTGRIYLSLTAISDMAQQFGFAPPEASARARARNAELEAELAQLSEVNARLIEANVALTAAGYQAVDRPLTPPPGTPEQVVAWVQEADTIADAFARARAALDTESLETHPRAELVEQLTQFLPEEVSL